MNYRALIVAAIVTLLVGAGGCSGAKTYEARFAGYEDLTPGISLGEDGTTLSEALADSREGRTGKVFVELEDGTRVKAECPFEGMTVGDRLLVQQNADGSWVVMDLLNEQSSD